MNPVLQARSIRVERGSVSILEVEEFSLQRGEIVCVIGPNGAGKTTLIQVLSTLLAPSSGIILNEGQPVNSGRSTLEFRRKTAMVFQEPLLFDMTVYGNVAAGLRIRHVDKNKIHDSVSKQLEVFGIDHLQGRSARTLSGGEAQRTSLARAFAVSPEIIFLDEPFASLDEPTRQVLIDDLEMALRETNTSALIATHDRTEALRMADRLIVMMKGRIVQSGRPGEVLNHPNSGEIAVFVGTETILEGTVKSRSNGVIMVTTDKAEIEAAADIEPGRKVIMFIRPEHVTLANFEIKTSARNVFKGRVEKIARAGFLYKVRIDCGFTLTACITHLALFELGISEGSQVSASIKATAIHVIRK